MDFDAALIEKWGMKTLKELHEEALREKTGIVYEALKEVSPLGKSVRRMLIVCLTRRADIDLFARLFSLSVADDAPVEDWSSLTVATAVRRAVTGPGVSFEELLDSNNERTALVLISAEPRSMKMLELALGLN